MKKILFEGCGTAIATPFTKEGINFKKDLWLYYYEFTGNYLK